MYDLHSILSPDAPPAKVASIFFVWHLAKYENNIIENAVVENLKQFLK